MKRPAQCSGGLSKKYYTKKEYELYIFDITLTAEDCILVAHWKAAKWPLPGQGLCNFLAYVSLFL